MRLATALVAFSLAAPTRVPHLQVPFFHQEKNGCGAASVAMVAHYWQPTAAPAPALGYDRLIDAERQGIQLAHMKSYLEEIGFHAFTLRGQWSDLEQQLAKGRPLIVSLQEGRTKRLHFAVLTGIEAQHVWLNDPTRNQPHRASRTGFAKQWAAADHWMLLATPKLEP